MGVQTLHCWNLLPIKKMSVMKRWILVHIRTLDRDTRICLYELWHLGKTWPSGSCSFLFLWADFQGLSYNFSFLLWYPLPEKKKPNPTNKILISHILILMFFILIRPSDFLWVFKPTNEMLTAFILYGVFSYHCYPAGSTACEDHHRELDIWDSATLFVSFSKLCKLACQV